MGLEQEGFDAVGADHLAFGGPAEDGEATVLGGDEGEGVLLVLGELGGGEVAGAAELGGVDDLQFGAFDEFGGGDLIDPGGAFAAGDFGAEAEDVGLLRDDGGAVDGG